MPRKELWTRRVLALRILYLGVLLLQVWCVEDCIYVFNAWLNLSNEAQLVELYSYNL